jgi:hypothetical protein
MSHRDIGQQQAGWQDGEDVCPIAYCTCLSRDRVDVPDIQKSHQHPKKTSLHSLA